MKETIEGVGNTGDWTSLRKQFSLLFSSQIPFYLPDI
jgi:hypothetical protein